MNKHLDGRRQKHEVVRTAGQDIYIAKDNKNYEQLVERMIYL